MLNNARTARIERRDCDQAGAVSHEMSEWFSDMI
jgi:hypothetical protein